MEQARTTLHEKLDQMLASGAITAEDYERLSKAMHASDAAAREAPEASEASIEKRLRRNRARRLMAGVCAGFASYFALDLVLVRILAVALTVVTGPVAPLCYLVLALALPWDEPAATPRDAAPATHVARPATHAWAFALYALLLFQGAPLCLGLFVGTHCETGLWVSETEEMPWTTEWVASRAGKMWELCDRLSSHFSSRPTPVHVAWLASVVLVAFVTGLLTICYLKCRRSAGRLLWVVLWAGIALSCFAFFYLGLCWPLLQHIERI